VVAPNATAPGAAWLDERVRALRASPTLAINELSNRLQREGRRIYKLGLGQSPFPVPPVVVRALQAHAHEKDYLPVKGLPALRAAVAQHHARIQGLAFGADDVMIGPGSKELMYLTQVVLDAELLVPSPSWVSYVPQARLAGRRVTWIPTSREENWHLAPNELAAALERGAPRARLLILNSPSNPNGYRIERDALERMAGILRAHGVIVIADEIYGLLDHEGETPSLATFYPEGTIVSSGLSKWCGAGGWRLGTFAFAPQLRWLQDAVAVVASETFSAVSAPVQHAAVVAFRGGPEIDAYLRDGRRILAALGAHCTAILQRSGALLQPPHGGFYLFPDFTPCAPALRRRGMQSSDEMCRRLLDETGVATLPGSAFGRPDDECTLRLSYVDFDGDAALAAVQRGTAVNDAFLAQYCARVLEAIEAMGRWVTAA
jgi:aspartate aminotransferase